MRVARSHRFETLLPRPLARHWLAAGAAALALPGCADDGVGRTPTPADGTTSTATTGDASGDGSDQATAWQGAESSSDGNGSSGGADTTTPSDSGDAETTTGGGPQPGAFEGYGSMTMGADSCPGVPEQVHVTSLDDSGAGTLREALSDGCRHIVFDVGGTITLQSDLRIVDSYLTIDGATAPEPGVTIAQPGSIGSVIEASGSVGPITDVVITYLRMDGMASGAHLNEGDIWGLDGEAALVSNIVLDHITAIAATDGVFDVWEGVSDVTISWSLITDTVTAMHMSGSGLTEPRQRISLHHNVFAGNNERQIRLRHNSTDIDYRNNVVYGWGWFEAGAAGLHLAYDDGEVNPSINVVGNAFVEVGMLDSDADDAIVFERGPDEGDVFFSDNRLPVGEADNVSTAPEAAVPRWATVTQYSSDTLGVDVLPYVGTHFPTPEETALLGQIVAALR